MYVKLKIKYWKVLIALTIILSMGKTSSAQGIYPISPFSANYFDPHVGFQFESYFNLDDFHLSFGAGLEDTGFDYSASFNVGFRPYFKQVLMKREENLFYQYHEKTFLISIDLEKRFYFLEYKGENRIGLYTGAKFGYFFGNYRGVSKSFINKFLIVPELGVSWEFKNARLNLGYLLLNGSEKLSPNMIQFKLNLFFNKNDE